LPLQPKDYTERRLIKTESGHTIGFLFNAADLTPWNAIILLHCLKNHAHIYHAEIMTKSAIQGAGVIFLLQSWVHQCAL
jgi:hypothetical protein